MELMETLKKQLAEYDQAVEEHRALMNINYGAAEALRRLIPEIEKEAVEEIENAEN